MPYAPIYPAWLVLVSVWRGRWDEARDRARDAASREPAGCVAGSNWSIFFLCECLVGHKEAALALLEERRSHLPRTVRPNTSGAWTMLFGVIVGLAVLREREAAAELYPLALEATETGALGKLDALFSPCRRSPASPRPPAASGSRPRPTTRRPSSRPTRFRSAASSRRSAAGTRRGSSTATPPGTTTRRARCSAKRWRCTSRSACRDTSTWPGECSRPRRRETGGRRSPEGSSM